MSPDEINELAWKQMRAMTDEEIYNHPASDYLVLDYGSEVELDIWDFRIAVRDRIFNELYTDLKEFQNDNPRSV